jgi:hypothetical protein
VCEQSRECCVVGCRRGKGDLLNQERSVIIEVREYKLMTVAKSLLVVASCKREVGGARGGEAVPGHSLRKTPSPGTQELSECEKCYDMLRLSLICYSMLKRAVIVCCSGSSGAPLLVVEPPCWSFFASLFPCLFSCFCRGISSPLQSSSSPHIEAVTPPLFVPTPDYLLLIVASPRALSETWQS